MDGGNQPTNIIPVAIYTIVVGAISYVIVRCLPQTGGFDNKELYIWCFWASLVVQVVFIIILEVWYRVGLSETIDNMRDLESLVLVMMLWEIIVALVLMTVVWGIPIINGLLT